MVLKKRGMVLAVGFFVIFTLLFVASSLFIFATRADAKRENILVYSRMDSVYLENEQVDFHLKKAFYNSFNEFRPEYGKEKFIINFKNELSKYKLANGMYPQKLGVFSEIENQINNDNIFLDSTSLKFKYSLSFSSSENYKGEEKFKVTYNNSEELVKNFDNSKISSGVLA